MKGSLSWFLPASLVILVGMGCGKPHPIVAKQPVPSGTALFYFTQKVQGPLDLTIDGIRIPVEKAGRKSKKKCRHLEVSGLSQGPHRFVLMSPLEAFGPDQFELELGSGRGEFKVIYAQNMKSVLYGSPEPVPPASGFPGVKAQLEP
jgi:hypothetical protein